MIRIPDARIPDARREDGLNMDLSKILNYPLLLQLTLAIYTSPLENKGRGAYDWKSCGGYEKKPRDAESGFMTYIIKCIVICESWVILMRNTIYKGTF